MKKTTGWFWVLEECLKSALSSDRAKVQIGRISRFGLLEMSRQRLRPSLGESSQISCPRCLGQGTIRGIESLALSVIRIIEEHALKENTGQVRAVLPVEIATFLLNEKRQAIIDIEQRQHVSVIIVPNTHFVTPHYEIERIRRSDVPDKSAKVVSYQLAIKPEVEPTAATTMPARTTQEPAIKSMLIDQPIPTPTPTKSTGPQGGGFIKKLFSYLIPADEKTGKEKSSTADSAPRTGGAGRERSHRHTHGHRSRGRRPHRPHSTGSARQHVGGEARRQTHHTAGHPVKPANDSPHQSGSADTEMSASLSVAGSAPENTAAEPKEHRGNEHRGNRQGRHRRQNRRFPRHRHNQRVTGQTQNTPTSAEPVSNQQALVVTEQPKKEAGEQK